MWFVIASLVTPGLNLVESKNLICENCHSGASISGNSNFVTNYILARLIRLQIPSFHFQSQLLPTTAKWAGGNPPIFPTSNSTTGALDFSLVASIWHYHQLRQLIITWLMTWLRRKNWRKKWVKHAYWQRLHFHALRNKQFHNSEIHNGMEALNVGM